MKKWTRRAFIGTGTVVGGGLVLGVGGVAFAPNRLRYLPVDDTDGPHLTTWVRISPADEVIAIIPHCEMGQGALTGIAMMLAEELDADWDRVRVQEAPADGVFANGYVARGFLEEAGFNVPGWFERALDFGTFKAADFLDLQITGGSTSTRATGQFGMRVAGASARLMLLDAAADRFGVRTDELVTQDSRVTHPESGRSASYGDLADAAATQRIPRNPALKPRAEYRIVGTSRPRRDLPSKVTGEATYGIDVQLPDLLSAAIRHSPVPGGTLRMLDPTPAEELPGVHEVVSLPHAVAVVADGYWEASQALEALRPEFDDADRGSVDSNEIDRRLSEALDSADPDAGTDASGAVLAEYRVPYLAHATMEPMCATARLANGRLDVWAGTQDPLNARRAAASAAELPVEAVRMHNLQLGGGFGRRLPGNFDFVEEAVLVARAVAPRPVKLIWSREEDTQHDYYRPAVLCRMRGELDEEGRLETWISRFNGSRLDRAAARPPYSVRRSDVRHVAAPEHLREGAWRSVASSQHGFFVESFVDELAAAAGEDPLLYRIRLLEHEPRHRAVLERVGEMVGWSTAPPAGRARGVAIVESFGSIVAEVAEVGLAADGRLRVYRVDAAVDCGLVVNPDQATAQIEGGIVFGLSAALYQQITVRDGAVEQRSFPDYPMVRLADAPRVRVEFLESDAPMGGLGEPGVPPVAPAVANAVFALTGRRPRSLPLQAFLQG